ncbi:MAG TPA: hypothetical protein VJ111_07860, partial [Chitinophagaceae bacterium]|nr:hypothetical protein [Chitinophagaceae bacterium]
NSTSELFGIETIKKEIKSLSDVESLKDSPDKFDYIYLCAHANHVEFGDKAMTYSIKWVDFGAAIYSRYNQ